MPNHSAVMFNLKHQYWLLIFAIFRLFPSPLAAQQEQDPTNGNQPHSLHAIVFESYLMPPPSADKIFDATELQIDNFPMIFSRLFVPFNQPQTVLLPPGIMLPREPMFLDIYTFRVTDAQIQKNKNISRHNGISDLDYKIKFLSWSSDRYKIELAGRHADMRFRQILIEAAADKTQIVRIRHSANRTLFVALTPIRYKALPEGAIPPALVTRPLPSYPSALSKSGWVGTVQLRVIVNSAGRIKGDQFTLLECPHYLFARGSLDVILNRWLFHPATRDGIPVEAEANIQVSFSLR